MRNASGVVAARGLAAALVAILAAGPVSAGRLACGVVPADASRIAVAGGSLVEVLYALGEEERIVAVDRTATWPAAARELPQIGYVRNVSAEGLLALEPTLVLGEHDMGPPEVVEQLERLGIDMLLVPEDFTADGIRAKVRCVADALGRESAGEALAASLLGAPTPRHRKAGHASGRDGAPAGIASGWPAVSMRSLHIQRCV